MRAVDDLDDDFQVQAYSDVDHVGCPDTYRSVTGFVLQLNGCSFRFKSKTQKAAADDTASQN